MAANSIDSDQYVDGSIDAVHLSANSIDSDSYVDGSIDNAHIADDAIDSEHYAAGSIDTAHIATNQIDETLMKDAFVGDFSDVTVTAADAFLYGDATDSGNTKKDTVQGILDLVSAGGWTSMGAVTTTSGSSTAITGIPAEVTTLMICLDDMSQTGTTSQVQMVIGDSGGYETSGYISTNHQTPGASSSNSTTFFLILEPGGSADTFTGVGFLTRIDDASNSWVMSSQYKQSTGHQNLSEGSKSLSAELTQVKLTLSTGSFDAGQWNIYYQ